ncbi:aminopeptidase, partial [Hydrogenophaga sp. 70-12]
MRAAALLLAATALVSGCARTQGLGYYWQSLSGHVDLMWRARPIDDWLADAGTPGPLKDRLLLAQRLRAFAVSELGLPDNASYHRYADLGRNAAVYNVVA